MPKVLLSLRCFFEPKYKKKFSSGRACLRTQPPLSFIQQHSWKGGHCNIYSLANYWLVGSFTTNKASPKWDAYSKSAVYKSKECSWNPNNIPRLNQKMLHSELGLIRNIHTESAVYVTQIKFANTVIVLIIMDKSCVCKRSQWDLYIIYIVSNRLLL